MTVISSFEPQSDDARSPAEFRPGETVDGFLSLGSDPDIHAAFGALTQALRQGRDIDTMMGAPHSPLGLIQDRLDVSGGENPRVNGASSFHL
jgi:hypothetical protein